MNQNRFRSEYRELHLGPRSRWIFRDDVHAGAQRTQKELAYYHTSRDLGLGVVPKLVAGSWNGRSGSLQRLVGDANRSTASIAGDAQAVGATTRNGVPEVDWDSLHAVAIQHYVTRMYDDAPYNILVSKSLEGKLQYHAIDGERSFGRIEVGRFFTARGLIHQSMTYGGPRALSPELLDRVRKTDIPRWKQHLLDSGVPPHEADAAVARLMKVQELGLDALLQQG